jgi:hypothetical protein
MLDWLANIAIVVFGILVIILGVLFFYMGGFLGI